MRRRLFRHGHGLGVELSQETADLLGWKEHSEVELSVEGESLRVAPARPPHPHPPLKADHTHDPSHAPHPDTHDKR